MEPSSLIFTGLSLRCRSPSRVILMTGRSLALSLTFLVLGTSISMPNSITCAVSMKMMSSTSTTSTNGVTLISARLGEPPRRREPYPPPLVDIAMALLPVRPLRHVEELHGEVVHARAHFADL